MKLLELKEFLNSLTPEQLQQPAIVVDTNNDDNPALTIDSWEISTENVYWDHCDCVGTESECKSDYGDKWDEEKIEFVCAPIGSITLHAD